MSAASVTGYRNSINTDSSDSDDDVVPLRQKRRKCSSVPAPVGGTRTATGPFARKVNNIWGSVVQEQSQEAVVAELGIMGMEGNVSMSSRQSETYNYVLARKMMEKERKEEEGVKSMLDVQLETYMQQRGEAQTNHSCSKRKRPAKERLGVRAEMDFEGRYKLTEDDAEDRVVDEIAHRCSHTHLTYLHQTFYVRECSSSDMGDYNTF